VLSDETQVHQILMNLGANAAHAMAGGGVLTVRLEPFLITPEQARTHPELTPGPHARLLVSDTGAGMSAEVLARALEPFYTTKPPGEGTGLGLSVIHGIVRAHHGSLDITSAPGRGTTVSICLPAADAMSVPAPAPTPEAAEARGPRVLFVEDEPVLALMQRRQLEYLGFEVTVHTSSIEALEDFRARPLAFALLITDDTMPQMTGSTLVREVLAIRPDLPVLMVSGGERSDPSALQAIGVRRLLRKPHTAAELAGAIREALGPRAPDRG
jgi:CheY-like chemotaxis protein